MDKGHALWVNAVSIRQGVFTPPEKPKKIIIPISVDKGSSKVKIKWEKWTKEKEKWATTSLSISLTPLQNKPIISEETAEV